MNHPHGTTRTHERKYHGGTLCEGGLREDDDDVVNDAAAVSPRINRIIRQRTSEVHPDEIPTLDVPSAVFNESP